MNGKELFEGMSLIYDRFVDEAEHQMPQKQTVYLFGRLLPMVACLFLILTAALGFYEISGRPEVIPPETVLGSIPDEPYSPSKPQQDNKPEEVSKDNVTEVPSVILRVEQMTAHGFIGTVAELVDTDIIPIGTELQVVFVDGTREEATMADADQHKSQNTSLVGSLVSVQFLNYDPETGTITVNLINHIEYGKDD